MAVIGVGLFGENHAKTYAAYHRSSLVCVCDANPQRAKSVAERYGCRWTADYREVVADPEIDAVSVATPDFAHLDPCLAVLESGKHLLAEKPLATSTAEAMSIADAAASRGLKLMVDFHNRWNPTFVKAKEEMDAGKLGRPTMGYVRLANAISVPTQMLSWSGMSGPQWFLLPHTVDLIRWLIGAEATRVYAVGTKQVLKAKGIDAYDAIQALVSFGDAFVTFETAWILPNSLPSVIEFRLNLVGTQGKLAAVTDNAGLEVASDAFAYPSFNASRESHGKMQGFVYEPIQHFVDCVVDDRQPDVTGEDGVAATAIIEAMLRSIESGAPVDL